MNPIKGKVRSDVPEKSEITPLMSGTSQVNVGKSERVLSAAGGALLSVLAMRRPAPSSLALLFSGAYLIYRGVSGNCYINSFLSRDTSSKLGTSVDILKTVTIHKPVEEIYAFWRQLENLPRFMKHLVQVQQLSDKKSHWEANLPLGNTNIKWDAIIVEEEPNQKISWRSVPGASIDNSGEVRFRKAPGNKGTEVQIALTYRPPLGEIGEGISKLLNQVFAQMIKEDIRRFKQLMETGEVATSNAQPTGDKKRKDDIRNYPEIIRTTYESAVLQWNQ